MILLFELFFYLSPLLIATFLLTTQKFSTSNFIREILNAYLKNPKYKEILLRWSGPKILFFLPILAFIEEVIIRGFLQEGIGIFFSSIIFAALHPVGIRMKFYIFIGSLYIGWVFEKSDGSLLLVTIIHGIHNIFAVYRLRRLALSIPEAEQDVDKLNC